MWTIVHWSFDMDYNVLAYFHTKSVFIQTPADFAFRMLIMHVYLFFVFLLNHQLIHLHAL